MPTTNIIGYLWSERQQLYLYSLTDVLQLTHDLVAGGLDCIRVEDIAPFGIPTGQASVQILMKEPEEWASLIHEAILHASVEHTIHMHHQDGDEE